jgi:hypothetical protein
MPFPLTGKRKLKIHFAKKTIDVFFSNQRKSFRGRHWQRYA